jgi:hypothetical protein
MDSADPTVNTRCQGGHGSPRDARQRVQLFSGKIEPGAENRGQWLSEKFLAKPVVRYQAAERPLYVTLTHRKLLSR